MPRRKQMWFRMYTETMRDMKIMRLSVTHRWLWVAVLSAARESPIPGKLMLSQTVAVDELDLSQYANLRVQDVRSGVEALQSIDFIEWDDQLGCWSVLHQSERQLCTPMPATVDRPKKTADTTPRAVGRDKYSALTNREIVDMIIDVNLARVWIASGDFGSAERALFAVRHTLDLAALSTMDSVTYREPASDLRVEFRTLLRIVHRVRDSRTPEQLASGAKELNALTEAKRTNEGNALDARLAKEDGQ